jgi:class 3 adenylate cyclase
MTAAAAPSGVVTFLFTDVEGSTRRWKPTPT